MTDVFTDDAPPIVDCDVLEAAKENIQPLAAGRRVTALSAILSTPQLHNLNRTDRIVVHHAREISDTECGSLAVESLCVSRHVLFPSSVTLLIIVIILVAR